MSDVTTADRPTRVGVGLVRRAGLYLIRQRPEGAALAGSWEFPGGKCEPGEEPEEATRRECLEETGLLVVVGRLRRRISHRYPHASVEVFYFDCETEEPQAVPEADTGFRWVAASELLTLPFPEANRAILEELANESVDGCDI